jgi:hypothetical protein
MKLPFLFENRVFATFFMEFRALISMRLCNGLTGEKARQMFVPDSLRKVEQTILEALRKADLTVIFSVTNYNVDKNTIDYVLVGVGDFKEVPVEAKKIVQKNLEKWKATRAQ